MPIDYAADASTCNVIYESERIWDIETFIPEIAENVLFGFVLMKAADESTLLNTE
jgi:hypothetical protein